MTVAKRRSRQSSLPAPAPAPPAGGKWRTPLLLVLTAGVLGLAAWLAFAPPAAPPIHLGNSASRPAGQTQADQVLATAAPLLAGRQYKPARDLLAAYVRSDPADTKVRPVLAQALLAMKDAQAAERVVDDLLRLDAQSSAGLWLKGILLRKRGADGAEKMFRHAAQSPQATPDIHARYGLELATSGQFDQAERYYRKALAAQADLLPAQGGLSELLIRSGRFEEAAGLLERAVAASPKDPDLWRMLADARRNLGQLQPAHDAATKALALTRDGPTLVLMGEIELLLAGQAQQANAPTIRQSAAEAFAAACDFAPVRADAAFKAARCYYFLERYALAMKYIDLARQTAPDRKDVQEWTTKIQDARFPRPTRPARTGSLLDVKE